MASASLNKNLITQFVWYLEKEKRYCIETFSTDRELSNENFYGKYAGIIHKKTSSRTLLNFDK